MNEIFIDDLRMNWMIKKFNERKTMIMVTFEVCRTARSEEKQVTPRGSGVPDR